MSKWHLPTQKGTQLFPQVTRSPTAVRIAGVPPHSALARAIVGRFANQISHFHRSQAQKYSLSIIENYRAHAHLPDLDMTYTNLQGQETILVAVSAHVVKEERERVEKTPPKWAVIELRVPEPYVTGQCLAKIVRGPVPGAVWPVILRDEHVSLVEGAGQVFSTDNFWFDFAYHAGDYEEVAQGQWVASMLIDLEPFWGFKSIGVEFYGVGEAYDVTTETLGGYAYYAQYVSLVTETGEWHGVSMNPNNQGLDEASLPIFGAPRINNDEFIRRHPEFISDVFLTDFLLSGEMYELRWSVEDGALVPTGNTFIYVDVSPSGGYLIDDYYTTLETTEPGLGTHMSPFHMALLPSSIGYDDIDGFGYSTNSPEANIDTQYNRWKLLNGDEIPFAQVGQVPYTILPGLEYDVYRATSLIPSGFSVPELPYLGVMTIDIANSRWGFNKAAT